MAGLRTASDERLYAGGIVLAVWLAGIVGAGLLLAAGQRRAVPAPPTAAPTADPSLAPAETLPPTIVTAPRAEASADDCPRAGEPGTAARRCAPAVERREDPAARARPGSPPEIQPPRP